MNLRTPSKREHTCGLCDRLILILFCLASYHTPNATDVVKPVIKKLSTHGPQENLAHFTGFRTRCTTVPFSIATCNTDHVLDYRSDVRNTWLFDQIIDFGVT